MSKTAQYFCFIVLCVVICVAGCGSPSGHRGRVEAEFQQRQKSYDGAVSNVESHERLCILLGNQATDAVIGLSLQDALFNLNRARYARGQASAKLDRAKRHWDNIREATEPPPEAFCDSYTKE